MVSDTNFLFISKQPSLGRVAVVAFYSNCDGKTKHMDRYSNRHKHHLLSKMMANRIRYSSAPALSVTYILPVSLTFVKSPYLSVPLS